MTIRTLFNIILKILGVLFIKDALLALPQVLSTLLYLTGGEFGLVFFGFLISGLVVGLYVAIGYWLIFKTEVIVNKLTIDKGFFEETIEFNMHRSTVLSICFFVMGGVILVEEIPELGRDLFKYFQEKRMTFGATDPSLENTIWSSLRAALGFILIYNNRQIVNFIERRRKVLNG